MRCLLAVFLVCASVCRAQDVTQPVASAAVAATSGEDAREREVRELRAELVRLSARLDALERMQVPAGGATLTSKASAQPTEAAARMSGATETALAAVAPIASDVAAPAVAVAAATSLPASAQTQSADRETPLALPGGATLNFALDAYYGFNFNQPPGRANQLRAYDVLGNTISIGQADVLFELAPDVPKGRRFGVRLDLQFGQATQTLQGNPENESRPDVYRNLFQAYGTYVVPVGKGVTVDFGKWASSLGMEGNYAKDQLNYSRSYYFFFLPFYHAGARASYHVNDKLAVNYWVVNGTNQTEPVNGYKDELFGFVLQPKKSITWTSNYYLGQEHADAVAATGCIGPLQPGLCLTPISPAPNGKLHILDNYATWAATPKLNLAGEVDYVIERTWATAAPGESSKPAHVTGGAIYGQYQATAKSAFAVRGEYLSDRGGLFSGTTQALKEGTGTWKYGLADGLDAFLEFRHDWANTRYFRTSNANSGHQDTLTLGLVWWYGGKQASW